MYLELEFKSPVVDSRSVHHILIDIWSKQPHLPFSHQYLHSRHLVTDYSIASVFLNGRCFLHSPWWQAGTSAAARRQRRGNAIPQLEPLKVRQQLPSCYCIFSHPSTSTFGATETIIVGFVFREIYYLPSSPHGLFSSPLQLFPGWKENEWAYPACLHPEWRMEKTGIREDTGKSHFFPSPRSQSH